MIASLFLLLAGAGSLAGTAALQGAAAAQGAASPQDVAAGSAPAPVLSADAFLRIGGEEIGGDEYGRWLLSTHGPRRARDFAAKHWVVHREAQRLGLEAQDETVDEVVEQEISQRIAGAFLGSREEWLAELARTERTEAGVRRQRSVEARAEVEARAIAALDRVVPEQLIVREWELRHGHKGRRYDVRMMKFLVVVPSVPGETNEQWEAGRKKVMEEGREKARAVREQVLSGGDFGALAARFSDDPDTREHDGLPSGGFRPNGWPSSFLDALEKLQPGVILEPTYARGGWWIVELRSVEVTPLESVRAEIEADLVARGPEPYEVNAVRRRLSEGLLVQPLPSMLAAAQHGGGPGEGLGAFDPVLTIGADPVSCAEYARWLLDTVGEASVERFAEEWLVRRKARSQGIQASDAEVSERARERVQELVDSGYHGDRAAWIAYLERKGGDEEEFQREITRRAEIDLLTERMLLADRKVSPADVRLRFDDLYGKDGRKVDVRKLRLSIRPRDPGDAASREDLDRMVAEASETTRIQAEALAARARAGEDFAALARSVAEGKPKPGGEQPEQFQAGLWPDEIARAVLATAQGDVSGPHRFGRDWWIFQVTSVRSAAFEDVREEIERELRERRPTLAEIGTFRNVLRQQVRVEVLPAMFR